MLRTTQIVPPEHVNTVSCCVLADLNATANQQYDALLMSNVVPMYREFKRKLLVSFTAVTVLHNMWAVDLTCLNMFLL